MARHSLQTPFTIIYELGLNIKMSIEGGVPRSSFWEPLPGGSRLAQYSSGVIQDDPAADHLTVSKVATNDLMALPDAMSKWSTQ
jgi:hypothetical protein